MCNNYGKARGTTLPLLIGALDCIHFDLGVFFVSKEFNNKIDHQRQRQTFGEHQIVIITYNNAILSLSDNQKRRKVKRKTNNVQQLF